MLWQIWSHFILKIVQFDKTYCIFMFPAPMVRDSGLRFRIPLDVAKSPTPVVWDSDCVRRACNYGLPGGLRIWGSPWVWNSGFPFLRIVDLYVFFYRISGSPVHADRSVSSSEYDCCLGELKWIHRRSKYSNIVQTFLFYTKSEICPDLYIKNCLFPRCGIAL